MLDVIICANFGVEKLSGLGNTRGQILEFPIEMAGHLYNRAGATAQPVIISKRRQALFGHVVRLDATTPAHQALCQVIAMKGGQSLGMNWRRPPGRRRKTWIQQIGNGTPASWRQMWQSADER